MYYGVVCIRTGYSNQDPHIPMEDILDFNTVLILDQVVLVDDTIPIWED